MAGTSKENDTSTCSEDDQTVTLIKDKSMINCPAIFKKMDERQEVIKRLVRLSRVGRELNICPPSIERLLTANRLIFVKKTLHEIVLNYNDVLFCNSSLCENLDEESFDEEQQKLRDLFESETNLRKYKLAIKKLKRNSIEAKKCLLDLINIDGIQPALHMYLVIYFKEILEQCDVLNNAGENFKVVEDNKDDICTAVRILEAINLMDPACSFLLGMLKRFNIGDCSRFMAGSWKEDLIRVVNVVRHFGFYRDLQQHVLESIDLEATWSCNGYNLYTTEKNDYIKQIATYSLYELALDMQSETFYNVNALKDIFILLSENEFPQAMYSYAAMLLVKEASIQNKETAIKYLNRAISAGHEGAMFLISILPFYNRFNYMLTQKEITHYLSQLQWVLDESDGSCTMHETNLNMAAYCLAAEYWSKMSYMVEQDKEKAEEILTARNMYEDLSNLQSREGL